MENRKLFDVIFRLRPLPEKLTEASYADQLVAAVNERLTVTEHRHRYLLLNSGHVADYMYFVERGTVRCFYFGESTGREVTSVIWEEGGIVCDPVSFFHLKASDMNIEVMPGTRLLSISYRQLREIFLDFPETEIFSRCISLQYVYYFTQRTRQLADWTAWERYQHMLKTHPGIELKLTKEIIASYLNITPQSLSRMIRQNGHP